ncbi:alpha-L-fucosidase [Sphingobacterium bovistauri]|uniref:alpha-L-fucosidase n=1 Tax=Sphingobacterium bovistauri TaxID=2781959 RepID=A0ABS7Z6R8_9SPHI|nr:alpha-L-fucosidase [Sphingobacterium bovistauri]MCA5004644.1 alpha-L-fucosidase [Sphingobacterium bovistauri]
MNRRNAIKALGAILPTLYLSKSYPLLASDTWSKVPFKPTWTSLENYKVPNWFRDAKFGIWAHWGPQCQPERGDWYARGMYQEGSDQYKYHVEKYGHPSKFGFKDVINIWKAEKWDPEALMDLYKRTGAQYFMTLANHHDNLDLYKSSHNNWNSLNFGPKKDIVGGWEKAARKRGFRFGVSVHAAHAWTWYETAQRADKNGPMQGVPYDGKLTKEEGKGTWWEGYDPQELYAQNHELSRDSLKDHKIHEQWHWDVNTGVSVPTEAYCTNFKDRTIELIDNYNPDVVYFDDTALPLWPISNVGLEIASHLYNKSIKDNKGKLEAVINGKILNEQQRKCMVWDIERGQSDKIEPEPWQTCTCIGAWHYDRRVYDRGRYKSAKTVIHMLVDVVSKNGNLLLSVPLRGDGSLDDKAQQVVEGIADWMQVNSEGIIGTRPWHSFGEGPAQKEAPALHAQGFNEGKGKPFTSEDIRFTQKGKVTYAFVMGVPSDKFIRIQSFGKNKNNSFEVKKARLLGYNKGLKFQQTNEGLTIALPDDFTPNPIAQVFKLS